jgi:hypothetical protein
MAPLPVVEVSNYGASSLPKKAMGMQDPTGDVVCLEVYQFYKT